MSPLAEPTMLARSGSGAGRAGGRRPDLASGSAAPTGEVPHGPVRLLSCWQRLGRADLAAHLAHHGLPPLPARGDRTWADRFVATVDAAGLGGRGGGGFPTAVKLRAARRRRGPGLLVNAMESEPESAKDALLADRAPHLVLDGAQLVALAVGAPSITICVSDVAHATAGAWARAVAERAGHALVPVPVSITRPPHRYVASEESALAHWLDEGVATPTFRVDRGVALRVAGRPVLVHNVETLAHVALVARHGPQWYRAQGTGEDPGTTLVTVSGAVRRPGVVEIAHGTPLVEVVRAAQPTEPVQAVLVGGRGGAWLGVETLDVPWAPSALRAHGAVAGAGVVHVVGDSTCGVRLLAHLAEVMATESAGQCGPCVFGLPAVVADLAALADGDDRPEVLTRLGRRLSAFVGRGACRHPDGVARMVSTGLQVFADDVARHRAGRPCQPAGWGAPGGAGSSRWGTGGGIGASSRVTGRPAWSTVR